MPFHEALVHWERHLIEQALQISLDNKSEAAPDWVSTGFALRKLAQLGMLWCSTFASPRGVLDGQKD
jgi:hypothetical protein